MEGRPDDAYGRVTNPERYLPVHDEARQLVDDLAKSYSVKLTRGPAADPALESHGAVVLEVVRLEPQTPGAASITVAMTDFPAVLTRAGLWRHGAYPHCGCDACDEDPADVVNELHRDIDALVCGRVTEEWDGERLHFASTDAHGLKSSGWTLVEGSSRDAYGEPRRYTWAPWQRAT